MMTEARSSLAGVEPWRVELLAVAAMAHAVAAGTRQMTFDRVCADIGMLVRAGSVHADEMRLALKTELHFLMKEGRADAGRAASILAVLDQSAVV